MATIRKNWHESHAAGRTFGQRVADSVAATMGSWTFIITQSVVPTGDIAWFEMKETANAGQNRSAAGAFGKIALKALKRLPVWD